MWKIKGNDKKITYGEIWKKIDHAASGLAHIGIKENDKVAILSNSNPMWGITDYALASLGAVSVPIYPTLPPDKIAYTIKNAHVRAIVIEDEEQWDKVLDSKASIDDKIMMYAGKDYEDQKQTR